MKKEDGINRLYKVTAEGESLWSRSIEEMEQTKYTTIKRKVITKYAVERVAKDDENDVCWLLQHYVSWVNEEDYPAYKFNRKSTALERLDETIFHNKQRVGKCSENDKAIDQYTYRIIEFIKIGKEWVRRVDSEINFN